MPEHPDRPSALPRPKLAAAAFAGLLLLVAVGCANRRAVLYQGVHVGVSHRLTRFSDADAQRAARQSKAFWRRELEARARRDPRELFANLAPAELHRRLTALAAAYGFKVISVELLRPRQLAPEIVVRTTHYVALADATRLILRQVDPKAPTGDDRTGWRYEGFYFRADDERGVPFLIVSNFWRGRGGGGGQWARSDRLFPFGRL